MPNPDNLRPPWKPGESGNPGGRPKGRSLTARLRELLDRGEINGKPIKDGQQVADLVAKALIKAAVRGNVKALQYIFDRVDGKIPDKVWNLTPEDLKALSDEELASLADGGGHPTRS